MTVARDRTEPALNGHLLVSDADHFRVDFEINPYMSTHDQPDRLAARAEHAGIVRAHRTAGRRGEWLPSAPDCPDMVFTANAGLVCGGQVVLARLPGPRRPETPHHRAWFESRGYTVVDAPYDFSGQGDALPCGPLLLAGSGHRTDARMHPFLADRLGYQVVSLRTVGPLWYDLDLALGVVAPDLLLWCPEAFEPGSRARIRALGPELVEVAECDARRFALNLVSDGRTVTMTDRAPRVAAELRDRGLTVLELPTTQLAKGGGGVRCTALTLHPAP